MDFGKFCIVCPQCDTNIYRCFVPARWSIEEDRALRHRLSMHTWGIEGHTHIKHAETEQMRITLWDVDLEAEYIYRDPREGQPDQTFVMEELPDISCNMIQLISKCGRSSLSANAAASHDGDTDDVDLEAEDISRDPREGQPDQTAVEDPPPDISDVVRGRPSVSANAAASHDDGDTAEARNRRARALMTKQWIVNVNQRLVNIESTVQRIEAMITEQIAETVEAETRAPWPPAPPRRPRSRSVRRRSPSG